jgi:hypothetical protein
MNGPEKGSRAVPLNRFASYKQNHREQREAAYCKAQTIEGKGLDVFHALALGHKGKSPDHGCEEKQEVGTPVIDGLHCGVDAWFKGI